MLDECEACAEAVLRGEAADGDVQGLAHDEGLAATGEAAEVEVLAGAECFAFDAEVAMDAALILSESWDGCDDEHEEERADVHFFFLFLSLAGDFAFFALSFFDLVFGGSSALAAMARPGAGLTGVAGFNGHWCYPESLLPQESPVWRVQRRLWSGRVRSSRRCSLLHRTRW